MTTPSLPPVDPEPGTATEPVIPAGPPPGPPPAPGTIPAAAPLVAPVFLPVAPEPAYAAPGPVAGTPRRSASSRILNVALGAALLVAAVGVAFAIGRASSPASTGSTASAGVQGGVGGGGTANGSGNGNSNGNGPLTGGGPNASFDLNGNDGGPGGGDIDGGLGLERGFRGAGGLQGTVTAVTADSVTITMPTGQVVTFKLDSSTTYHQKVAATASDIKAGSTVQVGLGSGFRPNEITQNADGSISLGTAGDLTVTP